MVLALDSRPQRLREQEMHRRHHLVAELTHSEGDDRSFQVHVGRRAEHLAEASVHPTLQDGGDARALGETLRDVAQDWLIEFSVGDPHCAFQQRALRLVKAATDGRA